MKLLVIALALIVFNAALYAQTSPVLGNVAAGGIDMNTSIGGFISEIASNEVLERGSVYLFDNWMPAKVKIEKKIFDGVSLNYNLQNGAYEYLEGNKVMRIKSRNIEEVWDAFNNRYIESRYFNVLGGTSLTGICKQTTALKKWSLITHYSLNIIEPNYIASLDVGNKERTFGKKITFYILRDNKELYPIITNRKKFAAQFESQSELILKELKSKGIDLKDETSLNRLIDFLNQNI